MRDGVWVLMEQLAQAAQRAEAAPSPEEFVSEVLGGLFREEDLTPLAKWVSEWMCVDDVLVFHENVRVLFVQSECILHGFCSSLDDYNSSSNVATASSVERGVRHVQKVCAGPASGA